MVGPRTLVAVVALLAVVPAQASLLQGATGGVVAYQFDGGSESDAPDACDGAGAAWSIPLGGATDGLLAPPDDMSDAYVVDVPATAVGHRLAVAVATHHGYPLDLQVATFLPGCASDVFDVLAQPAPYPAPPAPAAGERQHEMAAPNEPYQCTGQFRTFVLSRLDGMAAPSSIHVAWTNGEERTVPLLGSSHGYAAYRTTDDLGILVKGAWANAPATWEGSFFLAQGPCDAVDGGVVYGDPPSVSTNGLAFTPVRAGPHVLVVQANDVATPHLATTRTCHWCIGGIEDGFHAVSYDVRVTDLTATA